MAENKTPQAAILFDKFHVRRHLNEALDEVRNSEHARLTGKARHYIKGAEIHAFCRTARTWIWTEGKP